MSETNLAEMSFEEALSGLETVVSQLEDGRVPLDESIALYQRGAALKARCEALLRDAELKVQRIVAGQDGGVALAPEEGTPDQDVPPKAAAKARPAAAAPGRDASEDDIPF